MFILKKIGDSNNLYIKNYLDDIWSEKIENDENFVPDYEKYIKNKFIKEIKEIKSNSINNYSESLI